MESLALNPNIFLYQHISFLNESGLTFLAFETRYRQMLKLKEEAENFAYFIVALKRERLKGER